MNILGYLQKIGRALMVPVATLPAAAILMGIGYWIDPNGWGSNSALAAFLIKSGAAIIDNMSILFAVGIAYGMSKDKDGAAALSGLVGFYVLTTLLSPGAVSQIQGIPLDQVPKAFAKINNQFVGILVGVITAELYNRFSGVELHKALAFFSGRRLVPIVTSVVMLVVAFPLMYIWPIVFNGLVHFGESIMGMGPAGAGIYAFFNRLLIPVGLHHALNSVFWFDVAGINDIPNFLGGAKSLAEGKAVLGVTGMYQAGFFPIMMFGLPGAALAIYHAAKPQNKARVASLMIAAAFAAFFTGVTEPLEFSFMFVAPLLYLLHAVLTGVSVYIAASMQWIAGFGFSAGLVDLVLSTKNPLAKDILMLIVQGFAFFAIYYFSFRFAIKFFNLKTPGQEDEEEGAAADDTPVSGDTDSLAHAYVSLIGGGSNVVAIDACITRLRLTLNDTAVVDEAAAKRLGASGVIKLNKQNIQIIVGPKAELIATRMSQLLAGKGISAEAPAAAPAANAVVAPVAIAKKVTGDLVLLAPMSGEVVTLLQVPDAAFSSKAVGEGLAIRPTGSLVVAPVDGVIAKIFNTNHAFALIADNGAELIVHVGLDTVKLGGKGFTRLLEQGSRVKAGDAVLELDLEYLTQHAVSIISPVVLSNVDQFDSVIDFATGHVEAGKTALYTIKAK
ncbi:N-acetylglucosamine-specific PTS transporter subunit IIBC [Janthinobacterium sp. B9-8]|uniref:N-acetylglucosamine-specific PTS transporter subunit IIBC n=1 Tax=Janthinobacterium sp. B9-8 TaxID=1236179 RepID=UPI00061D1B34|nr:N-acetylglucosamine-specific PTS transporter subunit IIBC [Janthinobacterium sp. B9-8]AMC34938.1 PTS N-acetyl glucosamine transporter subunit IIABC [Janthinobacterium sp. B9-8]